jgi:hypothetical protein
LVSRAVDSVTYGELLGQERHHVDAPSRKYTAEEGIRALADSPTTTVLQALSDRSLIGLRPAKGFGPGRRPDVVNSIVEEVIEPARVRARYPHIYEQRQKELLAA